MWGWIGCYLDFRNSELFYTIFSFFFFKRISKIIPLLRNPFIQQRMCWDNFSFKYAYMLWSDCYKWLGVHTGGTLLAAWKCAEMHKTEDGLVVYGGSCYLIFVDSEMRLCLTQLWSILRKWRIIWSLNPGYGVKKKWDAFKDSFWVVHTTAASTTKAVGWWGDK